MNDELQKYIAPDDLFVSLQTIDKDKTSSDIAQEEKWLLKELYKDLKITPGQAESFRGHISNLKHGLCAAIPLICSQRCPFSEVCRAKFAGITPPEGKPCIVEINLLHYYRRLYLETFNVEEGDFGSFILVNELAELDMYDFRATLILALGDIATGDMDDERPNIAQALLTNISHFDEKGQMTHVSQEISAAFNLKEKLKNRKMRILDLLVATRREQYKKDAALGQKAPGNVIEEQAKIAQRLETILYGIEGKKTTEYYEKTIEEMPISE
jgi:hypothetical protein